VRTAEAGGRVTRLVEAADLLDVVEDGGGRLDGDDQRRGARKASISSRLPTQARRWGSCWKPACFGDAAMVGPTRGAGHFVDAGLIAAGDSLSARAYK
jgi:hypothetical protein